MIPSNITYEHIIKAIEKIKREGVPPHRKSKKYHILYGGEKYPPKYVISLANIFANGHEHPPGLFGGGVESVNFLKRFDFEIVESSEKAGMKLPKYAKRENLHPQKKKNKKHTERCPDCKIAVKNMLNKIYGCVEKEKRIDIHTKPGELPDNPFLSSLKEIHDALCRQRGFDQFAKANKLKVDFFIPSEKLLVEFDESQHFTPLRKTALEHYPPDMRCSFPVDKWIRLCETINASDNDPFYRDEQRAWYDTIRDFYPVIHGYKPIIRLYAGDTRWCGLDPNNPDDVQCFIRFLTSNQEQNEAPSISWKYDNVKILDKLIRFEYLTNALKLQYLIDCLEHRINPDTISQFYKRAPSENIDNLRILRSPFGHAFALYLDQPVFVGGGAGSKRYGHLLQGCEPENSELVKKLSRVNDEIVDHVKTADDWFPVFCEYMAIKTSVHELVVDVDDNYTHWGYSDLKALNKALVNAVQQEKQISIAKIRDFVVLALRIGLNPADCQRGEPCDISSLADTDYLTFMANRKEWIGYAHQIVLEVSEKISRDRIAMIMKWQKYSLCVFDCGPVFIRKRREYLFPKLCESCSEYGGWSSDKKVHIKMQEIVEKDVNLLIGRFSDYFGHGNDTVGYFRSSNEAKLRELKEKLEELEEEYCKLIQIHGKS